ERRDLRMAGAAARGRPSPGGPPAPRPDRRALEYPRRPLDRALAEPREPQRHPVPATPLGAGGPARPRGRAPPLLVGHAGRGELPLGEPAGRRPLPPADGGPR